MEQTVRESGRLSVSRADCQKVGQTVRKSGRLSESRADGQRVGQRHIHTHTHTEGRGDRGREREAGRVALWYRSDTPGGARGGMPYQIRPTAPNKAQCVRVNDAVFDGLDGPNRCQSMSLLYK